MPNSSYFYDVNGRKDKWISRKVDISFPPVNWLEINHKRMPIRSEDDIAIFSLKEDITQDRMPGGNRRGNLHFGTSPDIAGKLYSFGLHRHIADWILTAYQVGCNGHNKGNYLYRACDSLPNSSGSLLGTVERGEIRFRGIHNEGPKYIRILPASNKKDETKLNGTSSGRVLSGRHQTELAHDTQWVLQQAGCYVGTLDGEWGPASRKALATFASAVETELPGPEPSGELLAAVEKAAKEGTQVCDR